MSRPDSDGDVEIKNNEIEEKDPESPEPPRPQQIRMQRRGGAARIHTAEQAEVQGLRQDKEGTMLRSIFLNFLNNYPPESRTPYYVEQLDEMEASESTTLVVNWYHLRPADGVAVLESQRIADWLQDQYYRYEPYVKQAIQTFVRTHKPNYVLQNDAQSGEDKEFHISITNYPHVSALRDLKTRNVGQLCAVSGTVTRTTEVRPELTFGTFQCDECGTEIKHHRQQFKYSEPKICTNTNCRNTKSWHLDVEKSKFVDWQKARLQESSGEIPPGSMPRSIDVVLRGECVERCKPGDNAVFTGTLIVVPNVAQFYSRNTVIMRQSQQSQPAGDGVTGIKELGVRELNYKMVFLANYVTSSHKQSGSADIREEDEADHGLTPAEEEELKQMAATPGLYKRLTESIAPNIYGHDDVKRGILLMLFGGVPKKTKDGVKLRGDINICIIGDPSTAKSQFLKYVTRILPRTVYTSGKASTAAGLTAAVMKDPETGEFGVEAGALMLADNGICCIDEFDKMDALDQAAIHEAMEQQTITITKAGIQATLNARASILAAANPMWGRYDTSKPLRYNVNISPPIMSRFDLFFVVLDQCNETQDEFVARHMVRLHKSGEQRPVNVDFTTEQIQKYIRLARTHNPQITEESRRLLVRYYRQLRQRDQSEQKAYRFTVRQLESLVRLSEALARLELKDNVEPNHVAEAARLLKQSIISIDSPDISLDEPVFDEDTAMVDAGDSKAPENAMDVDGTESVTVQPQVESVSVNYQTYIQTANLIVYHIQKSETTPHGGMRQGDLEEKIFEEKEDEIDNMEDLAKEHKILSFIIKRLIEIDRILVVKQSASNIEDRILIVHPNYDPDSRNTSNLEVAGVVETRDSDDEGDNEENRNSSNQSSSSPRRSKRGKKAKGKKKASRSQSTEAEDLELAREAMDFA